MHIFKIKDFQSTSRILNPDLPYHSYLELFIQAYFKQLQIIENVNQLIGIYIEYEFTDYLFEKHPYFYKKHAHHIQERIEQHFNFGDVNLLSTDMNFFFMTMFNVSEDQIKQAFLNLHQDLSKREFIYHHTKHCFHARCGIYISSNIHIAPLDFYNLAKQQFENTILHPNCLVSTMNDYEAIFHEYDKDNE